VTVAAALAALLLVQAPAPAAPPEKLPESRHVVLGRSVEGRAIRAVRLGDPGAARKALVVGAIHGSERAGMRATRFLRRLGGVSAVDLWVVDTVNPDGVKRRSRGNARGVDLNRNFPYRWRRTRGGYYAGRRPMSEPETRVVMRWVERIRPAVTVWYHQPWGVVLLPCSGPAPLQRLYMRVAGFPGERCRGARLPGTATSWSNHELAGTRSFVVELPGGRISADAARRHARAARAVAEGG
jgi:protein MpaA